MGPLERCPVRAWRREDVEHDGALGPGRHLVRDIRRDAPRAAGPEFALLVADTEAHRPADDDPELLVRVLVLADDAVGLEFDDSERALLAIDGACEHAVPDTDRSYLVEVGEGGHAH